MLMTSIPDIWCSINREKSGNMYVLIAYTYWTKSDKLGRFMK